MWLYLLKNKGYMHDIAQSMADKYNDASAKMGAMKKYMKNYFYIIAKSVNFEIPILQLWFI